MKKKILFVMPSLDAGGGEKSLVNLLSHINYEQYDVDLFLFNKTGLFINAIPKEVTIIEEPYDNKVFKEFLSKSIKQFLKEGKIKLVISRIVYTVINRITHKNNKEQLTWKYLSKSFIPINKEYDVAIGFLEKSSIYFVIDKVLAKKKIGWIHTNYKDSGMNHNFDSHFFKHLNYIVTVSEECADSLKIIFDDLKERIRIVHNIVSPSLIEKLANEKVSEGFLQEKNIIKIITIGRLSHEKGIDLAINACKLLINDGYKIHWQVIGEGTERSKLEQLIQRNGLTKEFKLSGIKANPYPYLKNADIYVQPSRYEGKSIAIDEAKILAKPIIVTNFKTASDQIVNEKNGLIVNQDPQAIYEGIRKLIHKKDLQKFLVTNLSCEKLGTEEEIKKFYEMIEEVSIS